MNGKSLPGSRVAGLASVLCLAGCGNSVPGGSNTPLRFETTAGGDVAAYSSSALGAVGVGDLTGDGRADLVAGPRFAVFRNDGALTFTDITAQTGITRKTAYASALGDLDNDGDQDLVLSVFQGTEIYENDGSGVFTRTQFITGPDLGAYQVLLTDVDSDGLLDVYLSFPPPLSLYVHFAPNQLLRNLGALTFEDQSAASGAAQDGLTWASSLIDYDRDGDVDIYVANDTGVIDFGFATEDRTENDADCNETGCGPDTPSLLLENSGGTFTNVAPELGLDLYGSAMGGLVEDFDSDGLLDLFVTDFGRNKLYLGTETGFTEGAVDLGLGRSHRDVDGCTPDSTDQDCLLVSWGSALKDFDHDGRAELLIMNRDATNNEPQEPEAYRFNGTTFEASDVGLTTMAAHAVVPEDLDADGDLDLVISTYGGPLILMENTGTRSPASWLRVELHGTLSNRDGIGADVRLTLNDGTSRRALIGSGGVSSASLPPVAHFGLGEAAVQELVVSWPSGAVSTIQGPASGAVSVTEE